MATDELAQSANFNRPPRLQLPELDEDEVFLPPPPDLPDTQEQNWLTSIVPVLGIGVMAIFYVFRAGLGEGGGLFFAAPLFILSLFTIAGTVLAQRWRRSDFERRRLDAQISYIRGLAKKQARLQAARDAQIAVLHETYPPAHVGLNLALKKDTRLWERRPTDVDFVSIRLGIGRVPSRIKISTPDPDIDSDDLDRVFALADQYRFLHNAPVVAALQEDVSLGVSGRRAATLKAVRAMICHLAITHAPQDLHIHLIASSANADDWRWMEWLPHTSQSHRGGSGDLIAFDTDNIRNLMGALGQVIDERKERKQRDAVNVPHLLVVIDDPRLVESESVYSTILREGSAVGASALCLVSTFESIPADCGAILDIDSEGGFHYAQARPGGLDIEGDVIDEMALRDADHTARALSAVVMRESGGAGRVPRRVDFLDLYSVRYVEQLREHITTKWRRRIRRGQLPHPVPIGRESLAVATEMLLDEDHHGPHGVLAGTTGSGKSELLQTLICALVIEHDPRLLNLMLIDFKGGSTFNVFAPLPHTVGLVTNLDKVRVGRALEALKAETEWRQQFLEAKNMRDIRQYHRFFARSDAHVQSPNYQPLPHLFIIVDEFAQLAKEMPDFLDELVRTAQVGRSLGLHLLLGTQSPMDVITDEMNANMQFRICLRVQNIEASRAMLRRPDAAYLPSGWPGRGYFQVGEQGMFKQFQTAYVGADYEHKAEIGSDAEEEDYVLEIITQSGDVINLIPESPTMFPTTHPSDETPGSVSATINIQQPYTVAKAIVEEIVAYSDEFGITRQKPILLPPLQEMVTLAVPFSRAEPGGWDGVTWQPPGRDHEGNLVALGSAPVGLIDDVYTRTQNPLWINLNASEGAVNRKDGHVMVMGSPGTGKTMFIRTLAVSLARLHPPEKLHMYFVSFTGTGLDDLSALPHAEQVIYGTQTERVRRLFGRLITMLDDRQSGRADSLEPTMMVCIDQYEQFRDSYRDQHFGDFERLINEGRAAGIYVVITANGPTSVPDRVRSLIEQRVALQLGDATDYIIGVGRIPGGVESTLPNGRGYTHSSPPLICQISLPTLAESVADERAIYDAMRETIYELRVGYLTQQGLSLDSTLTAENQQSPAPIEELPAKIPLYLLPETSGRTRHHIVTPLGRNDDDSLSPFVLDWWDMGPHFIVTGPPGAGKTNLLQAAVLSAARQYSPDDVRFLLVDFNGRSLRALRDLKHVIRRVTDVIELEAQLKHLNSEMNAFYTQTKDQLDDPINPPAVPATVIVIDDYDLTSETLTQSYGLLTQLRDHVRLHSELGLYVWAAGYLERTGDPLIKQLLLKRSGFGFAVKESLHKLNVRTTGLPSDSMPDGRAYFPQGNEISVVQTAYIDNPVETVNQINDKWSAFERARWRNPASREAIMQTPSPANGERPAESDGSGSSSLGIDTAGLLEDLLGGQVDEGTTGD